MIPKIIHYCWLSNDPVPEDLQGYMASWKKFLPDYEFKKWDFTVFDKKSSEWVSEAFDSKKYAFAADYIRLFAIYNYGGIYLDMDIEVLRSFDPLLSHPRMFASESYDDPLMIEAGCFGAEKGDAMLGKCLEYYEGRHFVKEDGTFDMLPLPQILRKIIVENGFDIKTYGKDTFTCKSYETGLIKTTPDSYAIHHFAGSWESDETKQMKAETMNLSRYIGYYAARNLIQYKYAFKNGNVLKLTWMKISNKLSKLARILGGGNM